MRENLPDIQDREVKKVDSILTQENVNELFEYRDGELYWKIDIYSGKNNKICKIRKGDKAGCIVYFKKSDYYCKHVMFQRRTYKISRLIFLMFNGYLPEYITFKDGNSLNTKIENLIEANKTQVFSRRKLPKNNVSGYLGVCYKKREKKYLAQIRKNKVRVELGFYDTPEEAHKAYLKAKEKYYGEFLKKCES